MNKRSTVVLVASFAAIIGIVSAYFLTERSVEVKDKNETANENPSVEIYHRVDLQEDNAPSPTPTVEPVYYTVVMRDNTLCIIETNSGVEKKVKSATITASVLPDEDVELLKNGIHAFTLEEGIEIMENFIS